MGVIRKVIEEIDNSKKLTEDTRDVLNMLVSMAEARADFFEKKIESNLLTGKTTQEGLFVPVTTVTEKQKQYRCITSSGSANIGKALGDALKGMIKDPSAATIIDGIANIIDDALKVILGVAEGSEQMTEIYTVAIDGISIIRLDFAFWSRKLKVSSIKEYMESALACVAIKSIVDVKKLSFNDFLAIYNPVISSGLKDIKDEDKRVEKILKYMENARKIYDRFVPKEKDNFCETNDININMERILKLPTKHNGIFISAPVIGEGSF